MIQPITKIETGTKSGNRYATAWFKSGGRVRFIESGDTMKEQYFTPEDPSTVWDSYEVEADCGVHEPLVRFLESYGNHDSPDTLQMDFPDAFIDTLGIKPSEVK